MMPLTGGPVQSLVACVEARGFDSAIGGVSYIACGTRPGGVIHRLNPATGKNSVLGSLDHDVDPGNFAVSPDETTILYDRTATARADLMLIENFR